MQDHLTNNPKLTFSSTPLLQRQYIIFSVPPPNLIIPSVHLSLRGISKNKIKIIPTPPQLS